MFPFCRAETHSKPSQTLVSLNFTGFLNMSSFLTRLGEHVIWSDLRGGIDTFSSFKFVIVIFGESERRKTTKFALFA